MTGRQLLEHYIATGWTDDEIVANMGHFLLRIDDTLFHLGAPPERRRLKLFLAEMRGVTVASNCPGNLGEVERAYRRAGVRPTEETVATNMGGSDRTVRRYLRECGINSWRAFHSHMTEHHPR